MGGRSENVEMSERSAPKPTAKKNLEISNLMLLHLVLETEMLYRQDSNMFVPHDPIMLRLQGP